MAFLIPCDQYFGSVLVLVPALYFSACFLYLNPGLFIADISPLSHVFLLVKKQAKPRNRIILWLFLLDPYPDVRYLARADPDPEELYHLRICLGYETLPANKSWCKYFHFPFVDKMQTFIIEPFMIKTYAGRIFFPKMRTDAAENQPVTEKGSDVSVQFLEDVQIMCL